MKVFLTGATGFTGRLLTRNRPEPVTVRSWPIPVLAALARLVNRFVALPPMFCPETLGYPNGLTYWFTSNKAQHELGCGGAP
jgi:hypothetical protein